MKLVTFKTKEGTVHTGWLKAGGVVEMQKADKRLPNDMLAFIDNHESYFRIIKENRLEELMPHYQLIDVRLMAPLTNPRSIRDYLSFEQHMLNASKTFGHSIGEAYYDIPVFYFTNHNAVFGPQDEIKRPKNETKMDFELELAVVMGKKGSDIPEDETDDYIFGYTIFNDWTARSLQREEMTLPLGPAKGKDFANAFGPCIVTKDEFEQYSCTISRATHPEHLTMPKTTGDRFDVKMSARINGETICEGNYKTAYWTFAQMIKRASDNVTLLPGDILGSGTVGWGSLIENNFSVHRPLEPGDQVELEIEGIGVLSNKVI
ncbi:MAG: fumarylacetoacetate hydrolase family protein [Saprospiraceae bacterium]|jgi:2-keto-4-pentenoate hydratase/2-oxohepta-3-ene-1,7-dioic acid hydratase in catechol pathway|nr:fumarylacetoacetate hydrolase family protein [Saprospiraceae bacterium]